MFPINSITGIFTEHRICHKEISRLHRLTELFAAAERQQSIVERQNWKQGKKLVESHSAQRGALLEVIKNICEKALVDEFESFKEFKKALITDLNHQKIAGSYVKAIEKEELPENVQAIVRQLLKDSYGVGISPVMKSIAGINGPTLLVNYIRNSIKDNNYYNNSYVIKWTDKVEFSSNIIYNELIRFLTKQSDASFKVADSSAIDFCSKVFYDKFGRPTGLDENAAAGLKEQLIKITEANLNDECLEEFTPKELIMLANRILGEDLYTFAIYKYQALNPAQKINLFTKLGHLALLDLLTGNLDRLVAVSKGEYCLEDFESNTGNVMITFDAGLESDDNLAVYAIDNGIQEEFLDIEGSSQAEYMAFLQTILQDTRIKYLPFQIATSIKNACEMRIEDEEGNSKEIKKRLQPFIQDLYNKEIGLAGLYNGIKTMLKLVKDIPDEKWEIHFQDLQTRVDPQVLQSIQGRILNIR